MRAFFIALKPTPLNLNNANRFYSLFILGVYKINPLWGRQGGRNRGLIKDVRFINNLSTHIGYGKIPRKCLSKGYAYFIYHRIRCHTKWGR
mgnify:FL=1